MNNKRNTYRQRTDFLWQSVSFYGAILVIYSLISGSVSDWEFILVLKDPIVLVLSIIIVIASLSTLWKKLTNRTIIITNTSIILKSRFGQIKHEISEIEKIEYEERIPKNKNKEIHPIFSLHFKNIPRALRLRTAAYKYSKELSNDLMEIQRKVNEKN